MKAKILLVLTYPKQSNYQKIDAAGVQIRKAAKKWVADPDDPVLAVTLPDDCKLQAYAVLEDGQLQEA